MLPADHHSVIIPMPGPLIPRPKDLWEKLPGPLRALAELAFPSDDLGIGPAGMTAARKIKGFTTFGGKVVQLRPERTSRTVATLTGPKTVIEAPQEVARILEGREATKALQRLTPQPEVERVVQPSQLADVVTTPPAKSAPALTGIPRSTSNSKGIVLRSVLSPDVVRTIRTRVAGGESVRDILRDYPDLKYGTVDAAVRGETWRWVK